MSAQHTPGPWQAVEWACNLPTTIKAGDMVVAECSGSGRYAHESLADARLIAAAPDLLAELQNIANANPKNWDSPFNDTASFQEWAQSRARAAIAKAIE